MESKHRRIYLKIQELLSVFNRAESNSQIHLMPFLNKKAGLLDRKNLRKSLIHHLKSHKNYKGFSYNWTKLLKIKTKPSFPYASLSISYCYYLGVFIIVFDQKTSIGFDIERKNRVTSPVVRRVSSHKEIDESPHPALLWTAKEACVKSLSTSAQPVLFKDCILSNWKKSSNQTIFLIFPLSKAINIKELPVFLMI